MIGIRIVENNLKRAYSNINMSFNNIASNMEKGVPVGIPGLELIVFDAAEFADGNYYVDGTKIDSMLSYVNKNLRK